MSKKKGEDYKYIITFFTKRPYEERLSVLTGKDVRKYGVKKLLTEAWRVRVGKYIYSGNEDIANQLDHLTDLHNAKRLFAKVEPIE